LVLSVTGKGFTSNSVVRLDGTPLPAPTGVTDRQLSVTVPAAFLSAPRRFALDVVTGSTHSNVADFTVLESVDVTSSGCTAPAPGAVAIDAERNLAVVTNTGCGNISLIDLTSGAVTNTIAVGTNPQGVAVISRLGRAVVTNRGSNNASLVDLVGGTVTSTVTVGTEPIGVAINQDTAMAVVTNSASNNISVFPADVGGSPAVVAVDQRPVAVAIDPGRDVAVVADAAQNNLILLDLSQTTPAITARVSTSQPTGVVFDPVTGLFLVASSLANSLVVLNPDTQQATSLRVGINPTSLAFNFQSSTLVTVNTASNTVSVMDFQTERVRAILGLTGSSQFAVDIHPRTNLAVVADQNNNRVLLVPLPR
jgi:YVTN family beta-propeller protein